MNALIQLRDYVLDIVNIVSTSFVLVFIKSLQVCFDVFLTKLLDNICLISYTLFTQLLLDSTNYCWEIFNVKCLSILLVLLFLRLFINLLNYFLHLNSKLFNLVINLFKLPWISCQNSLHYFAVFNQYICKCF